MNATDDSENAAPKWQKWIDSAVYLLLGMPVLVGYSGLVVAVPMKLLLGALGLSVAPGDPAVQACGMLGFLFGCLMAWLGWRQLRRASERHAA